MSVSENAAELGPLPQWDLSDLYPGRDSAALKAALDHRIPQPARISHGR